MKLYNPAVSDRYSNRGDPHVDNATMAATNPATGQQLILATGGGGGITITLPAASLNRGKVYRVKKVDAGAGAVTVTRAGADTIDGAANYGLAAQYDAVTIVSDGAATWHIVGSYP